MSITGMSENMASKILVEPKIVRIYSHGNVSLSSATQTVSVSFELLELH